MLKGILKQTMLVGLACNMIYDDAVHAENVWKERLNLPSDRIALRNYLEEKL